MRWVLAVVLASFLVFLWGFFFWAASGVMERTTLSAEDDSAAAAALTEHFPKAGLYLLPGMERTPAEREALALDGPIAMVHIVSPIGRSLFDPGIMYAGYCHILLTCIFLAILLSVVDGALPTWLDRVRFFLVVGLLVALYGKIGEAVWWQISWNWQVAGAFYDFIALTLAGLVIATIAPRTRR